MLCFLCSCSKNVYGGNKTFISFWTWSEFIAQCWGCRCAHQGYCWPSCLHVLPLAHQLVPAPQRALATASLLRGGWCKGSWQNLANSSEQKWNPVYFGHWPLINTWLRSLECWMWAQGASSGKQNGWGELVPSEMFARWFLYKHPNGQRSSW